MLKMKHLQEGAWLVVLFVFLHVFRDNLCFMQGSLDLTQTGKNCWVKFINSSGLCNPGDLDTRKSTGTSCQIEIHFMIKTTEYLL
jgi:hypothetical protein